MTDQATRPASCARNYQEEPQEIDAVHGTRTWLTRGANFVIAVSEANEGSTLVRDDNPDEYMVILPEGVAATIRAGDEVVESDGDSLTIVPPGPSSVTIHAKGLAARVFSKKAEDLAAAAGNAAAYADGAPEVAPLVAWPDPVDGFHLRHYRLADYADPNGPRIQPRLFRCTNLMVNIFVPYKTRRDIHALSPHWHEDFEQGSLTLFGNWIHHLRYPWTADMEEWREDDHPEFGTPSTIIMPAKVIHTSRDVGKGIATLIDIFAPPRLDFSKKPGFVINEAEYPLPEDLQGTEPTTKGALLSWQKPGS